MRDEETLLALEELASARKEPTNAVEWITNRRGQGETLAASVALVIDGASLSGIRLELYGPRSTPADRLFYGLTAMLLASIDNVVYHLGRVEFDPENPLKPHRNRLNPHGAPPIVQGPQVHRFAANTFLGLEAFRATGNLPIAFPLEAHFAVFENVLDVIRKEFVIPSLWMEESLWSRTLV